MTTPTYRWEWLTDRAVFDGRLWLLGGWNPRDMQKGTPRNAPAVLQLLAGL
jgi:hypothetical protein